jgi:hypothetical protein
MIQLQPRTWRGGDDLITFFRVVPAGYALVYEPRARYVLSKRRLRKRDRSG